MEGNILSQPLKNLIDIEILSPLTRFNESFMQILDFTLEKSPFYKDYLRYFDLVGIEDDLIVVDIENDEMDLFLKLMFGSFSCEYSFEVEDNGKIRVIIITESEGRKVEKYLDELFNFQVFDALNTFLKEQIELELLKNDDENEKEVIESIRQNRLKEFYKRKEEVFRKRLANLIKFFKEK
jgi:hypothetical protein